MSGDASELKADLRRKLRAEAQRFSSTERQAASLQICRRLAQQDLWQRAQSVLFYYPMAGEPDIHPVFAEALAAGKAAVLPRYCATERHYEARQVHDLEHDLQAGAFGIHEPTTACPIFDLKKLDFVLVPGIGFAFSGIRLGRAGGSKQVWKSKHSAARGNGQMEGRLDNGTTHAGAGRRRPPE